MLDAALSLMILAAIALAIGAIFLWRRGERQRPALMALLVMILIVNVGIWTLPDASGEAPTQKSVE
jgi:cyanate permease